jgi:hypothetical protein
LQINPNPDLNDYIVTIHYKYSNPPRTRDYPLAWHIHISNESDPKLCWAVDHWRSMTRANILENHNNGLQDLNILSNLCTQVSKKKAKLSHPVTELIVKVRYGENQIRDAT